MQSAIADLDDEVPLAVKMTENDVANAEDASTDPPRPKVQARRGQIGEGKGAPLSQAQRKRELYVQSDGCLF